MSDRFSPVFGDRRGSSRTDHRPAWARHWWLEHSADSGRLAQWLDDACADGFTRLEAVGINDVDWWLDAVRLDPEARRRYRLDANSELEWLLSYWPRRLRTTERPTNVRGYLTAGSQ